MEQVVVKTPNYSFLMTIKDLPNFQKRNFYVGDENGPCLEASIFMPYASPLFEPHIGILHQIDALEECASKDTTDPDAKFGVELLYAFVSILKANYPHITKLALRDASYIPCNRRAGDTLDLLAYNIALYGKTWYEAKAGAHTTSIEKQRRYKKEIDRYMDPHTKKQYSFQLLLKAMISGNNYASTHIHAHGGIDAYKTIYERAETFSDFFQTIKSMAPYADRCKFFKGWLESWLSEFVYIERYWIIDIDTNSTLGNVLNTRTRRQKRPKSNARGF